MRENRKLRGLSQRYRSGLMELSEQKEEIKKLDEEDKRLKKELDEGEEWKSK